MPPSRYFDKAASATEKVEGESSKAVGSSNGGARDARKNRRPQTTLFISSLPFNATSTDLTTLFSDIGPLRRAFVVTDKESQKSKGVGYVTFAVREDAEQALAQLQGHSLDGRRKMRLEWSTGKDGNPIGEGSKEADSSVLHTTDSPKTARKGLQGRDPDAVRTIIVTGLSQCKPAADSKALYKRARKIGDVDNVIHPAPSSLSAAAKSEDVAHIVFRTPNHAMTAVTKLHAHTFKGALISVVLKKRADGAARLDNHMRPETKKKRVELQQKLDEADRKAITAKNAKVNQGSRLIVRNLPFDVAERDLRAVFLPYGPIYSIDVPQTEGVKVDAAALEDKSTNAEKDEEASDEDGKQAVSAKVAATSKKSRGRGFAFVWMVSRADAVKAMAGVNSTAVGRGAAEKTLLKAAKGKAGRDKAKAALDEVLKKAQSAREVAVDWALSKTEWESKKDQTDDEESQANSEEDSGSDSESDLDPMEVDEEGNSEEEEAKPSLPKPEEGTTLFIRNLPYQATEEELRDLFRSFGPMRYAKLTMDPQLKRAKGTAFVCFWQRESAEKALEQARKVESDLGGAGSGAKAQNPFSAPSILTADPSATLTASLTLHGRVLSVTPALERSQANDLATAAQSAREKKDKRNTYLMREGVPMPDTELAKRLSEAEIDRRLASFQARKTQLAKNPSLYLSKTRLSVRQLPLFVSERILKRMAEYAVKHFDEAVENGERQGLTEEELAESRRVAVEYAEASAKATSKAGKQSKKQELKDKRETALLRRQMTNKGGFIVRQTKIIRAKDRLDSITGQGRSQGYGFIEMTTFADALKVVRFANGNNAFRKVMLSWYAEELGAMAERMAKEVAESKDAEIKARLKRVVGKKAQLDAGQVDPEEEGTRGGLLIVEFSVENVVTVKRKSERQLTSKRKEANRNESTSSDVRRSNGDGPERSGLGKRKGRSDEQPSFERESKKPRRPATWNQKTKRGVSGPGTGANSIEQSASSGGATAKKGEVVGSIVGGKRQGRQARK